MTGSSPGARLLGLAPGESLVLASASPRRAELLRNLGVRFRTRPVRVDETLRSGEAAEDAVVRLAEDKVRAAGGERNEAVVVAADTLVVAPDGEVLGKPVDEGEARAHLLRLADAEHRVVTGVAVAGGGSARLLSGLRTTRVRLGPLAPRDLEALVASGEGRDKAGAYGIQGLGGLVIEEIRGDYFNVVGLPLFLLRRLIHDLLGKESP